MAKKAVGHESDGDTNYSWFPKAWKRDLGTEDQRKNCNHPDYTNVKIS